MNTRPTPAARLVRQAFAAAALASSLFLVGCGDSPETMLAKAKESIEKKEPKAAEIHLKNLLQKEDNAEARYLLGMLHLEARDLRSAEKELTRAQQAGFDPQRLALPLARTRLQLGEPQKAIDEAAKAAPTDPVAKAELATLVGRAWLALGKRDEAKRSFESALQASADHAPAQAALVTLQAAGGDLPGASAAIDLVLQKSPASPEAMSVKAELEQAQGRPAQAREWFAKVADADPKDRESRIRLVMIDTQAGDFAKAQSRVDELKRVTGPAAITMYLQSMLHYRQEKLEPARDAIQASLKAAPDYLPALALGSEIFLRTGNLEQAEQNARKVVDLAPNSTQGYRLLGAALLRKNAPEKALEVLKPALDRGSKDPAIYTLAGEASLRTNEPAKAAAFFDKAIALDPDDPRKKAGLAFAHIAGGDRERGIAELETVSLAAPDDVQADLALVSTHLRARQFDKALAAIDRFEKKRPDSAVAAALRGSALLGKGDAAGGRKALELALSRDPKYLAAASTLASLDVREGKREDGRKRFTALLEQDPRNIPAMLTLARFIQSTAPRGDAKAADEALVWLKKATETDPSSVQATLALAGWHTARNQAKEAVPMLQQALARNPDDPQILDALGTAYLRSDQDVLGMETLEKILRARPDDAMLQIRMGQLKISRNDVDGALVNLRRAVQLQPKAIEPRIALAAGLARAGKAAEARSIAATLQKEAPKNAAGLLLEGDIAMSERKFGDAESAFRKALALQKVLPIQIKLHQAVYAGGDHAQADAMIRSMVSAQPDDLALRGYAGQYEIARQRWSAAIAHYRAVVEKQPGNALALNNMAWAMHEAKDPAALETAEKALAAAPNVPSVMDTAGVILVTAGQAPRGLELMRKAVAAAPKAPALRLHLAQALLDTGDKAGARTELDALLKDNPQGPVAERARELEKKL
ncbi:XrtA/PEP-CTERM system TPR-repeat protein PrsT [Quisquiliibacterium transsilvanicum]|uniref:Putative PEP-CTERM system TPR-repeat lipoprotein n=1 Tax=Quisquiliibacterium transsilvanicum TaxID=1549638 RepID=A0A7W8HEI7_9BURK|nr:XrtA/PEP-CTERM system TPR-repeat protein PrsT [Quisquiliibacterium transsilvanicum]MBB5270066.1 putative PEP-CTERM system TPR-repeat lipoprotein [Quisquiliibacterium transsilvanicum]